MAAICCAAGASSSGSSAHSCSASSASSASASSGRSSVGVAAIANAAADSFSSESRKQQQPNPGEDLLSKRGRLTVPPKMYYRGYEREIFQNKYHAQLNPTGVVMLALSENSLCTDLLVERYNRESSVTAKDTFYADYKGIQQLKRAIASEVFMRHISPANGAEVTPEHLMIAVGAGAIVNQLLWTIGDPGDSVLIPTPYYNSFSFDVKAKNNLEIVGIHRAADESFRVTKESLERAYNAAVSAGSRPRVLLLCSPDNPTGKVYSKDELREIVDWIATKKTMHLVSDEVYALSVFEEGKAFCSVLSLVEQYPELRDLRTHVVWGLSKDFGMSGFRVGVLHTRNDALHSALSNLAYFSAVPNPVQVSLASMLSDVKFVDEYVIENKKRLRSRYQIVKEMLGKSEIPFYNSSSGLFLWLDLRKLLSKSSSRSGSASEPNAFNRERDLLLKLRDFGVWLAPGETFGAVEPGYFRLCFAQVAEDELRVGLQRLITAYEQIKQ